MSLLTYVASGWKSNVLKLVAASILYAKRVLTSLACGIPAIKYSPSGDTAILLPKSASVILNSRHFRGQFLGLTIN